MHLRKKGAQAGNIRLALETIHRGPLVSSMPLPPHTGLDHGKKREQTLREDRCGRRELVEGRIPHQLVLCLVQPVHELRVAGGLVVRGHSEPFLWHLKMPDRTRPAWRLANTYRCTRRAAAGGMRGDQRTATVIHRADSTHGPLCSLRVQRPWRVDNRPENPWKTSHAGSWTSRAFSGRRNRRLLFADAR
jgi:hypothetical protein